MGVLPDHDRSHIVVVDDQNLEQATASNQSTPRKGRLTSHCRPMPQCRVAAAKSFSRHVPQRHDHLSRPASHLIPLSFAPRMLTMQAYPLNAHHHVSISDPSRSTSMNETVSNGSPVPGRSTHVDPALSHTPVRWTPWLMHAPGQEQFPLRLLTIFMEDVRGGRADLTMAEILVMMQPDGEGGWLVDGDSIFERLQSTAGRVEGQGKISARRGKYKQTFYRLGSSAPSMPSMLRVAQDRKLEILIEPLQQTPPPESPYPSVMKRTYDDMSQPPSAPSTPPKDPSPSVSAPPEDRAGKRTKASMNVHIVAWLKDQIRDIPEVEELTQSKGRILPIPDLIRTYRVAQGLLAKYNDMRTPATLSGAPDRKISKANVLTAIGRQTSWGNDMETTLNLMDLYGPGMAREDPSIVALIQGQGDGSGKEGSVYLLNTLKKVDQDWRAAHDKGGGPSSFPTPAAVSSARRKSRKQALGVTA